MEKIKVLIADDSVVYRSQIRAALQQMPRVEIVGAASNGRLALERLAQSPVDLLILDLEMPELDGLQTLREMNSRGVKAKALVFSSTTRKGAEAALEALRLGASDFIAKPGAGDATGAEAGPPNERIRAVLEPRIHAFFPTPAAAAGARTVPAAPALAPAATGAFRPVAWEKFQPQLVVIGCSTGGPTVLEKIFAELRQPPTCPVVIVQHMPAIFTAQLAERLGRLHGLPTFETKDGMKLERGCVYVAAGGFHSRLRNDGDAIRFALDQGPLIQSVRPAVDPLFETAAALFGDTVLGFVLTGMGADGKRGAEALKARGSAVVIQSEDSCVVFGMPGAVQAAGAYDRIANPWQLIEIIRAKACGERIVSSVA